MGKTIEEDTNSAEIKKKKQSKKKQEAKDYPEPEQDEFPADIADKQSCAAGQECPESRVNKSKVKKSCVDTAVQEADPGQGDERPRKKKKSAKSDEEQTAADEYRKKNLISSDGDAVLPHPLAEFDCLPFHAKVVAEMKKAGFQSPSPIQAQGWPVILAGSDLIAIAKTGSGKTLGFLLPVFHRISENEQSGDLVVASNPRCLVLAPTRELAMQIHAECTRFGARAGIRSCCIYGGVPLPPQRAELRVAQHVVVATPGRMADMLSQSAVSLGSVKYLILDEADRMLDMVSPACHLSCYKHCPDCQEEEEEEEEEMKYKQRWGEVDEAEEGYTSSFALFPTTFTPFLASSHSPAPYALPPTPPPLPL
jgi:ATP-dependent helicase YprA (DUF1998 family)